jgi:hypothetical protein
VKEIRVTFPAALPSLPNFLRSTRDGVVLDIADASDESLREIGAAWTEELVAHAQRRRGARKRAADAGLGESACG